MTARLTFYAYGILALGVYVASSLTSASIAADETAATAMPTSMPPGELGRVVALGREIVEKTGEHPLSKPYVRNALTCKSCHLEAGTHPQAATFLGVATAYPAWAPREKRVITLEDRVLNCFIRSMNGVRPPNGSEVSVAVTTYITWLASGQPIVMNPQAPLGPNHVRPLDIDVDKADVDRGRTLYADHCGTCHGEDGEGTADGPPVWGDMSYNDGAGLSRVDKLASWLKVAMPLDDPHLSEQDSLDIAAFVNSRPRPHFQLEAHLPKPRKVITILHTNDIHGHLTSWQGWTGDLKGKHVGGLDRLATAVNRVRREGNSVLLLDAGDLIGDTMIADLTAGTALIRTFNAIGYDAVVPGNHEPDFGSQRFKELISQAAFSVLAANLQDSDGDLVTQPYLVKDFNGTRVGVIGLTYPKTPSTTAAKNVAELRFQPPAEVARHYLEELRQQGVDVIIALTHLGLGADIELAKQVPEIDVIVGGHSHNRMSEALRVNETLIVQAGAHGSDLGRLDLVIEDGQIRQHHRQLYPLVHDMVSAETQITELIEDLLAPHRENLDEQIGQAEGWLIRAQTLAGQEARKRHEQSPVDSLFADILREQTGADIAFLPGVGYGVAIPPGPITAAQLRQLIPHDGKIITMRLSAEQVRAVLEQAIENVFTEDIDQKVGGMIQISGLRFSYNPKLPRGERVIDIRLEDDDWSPDGEYLVATNAMLAAGGHHQSTFALVERQTEHQSQYQVVKAAFQRRVRVSPPTQVRITRVDTREK